MNFTKFDISIMIVMILAVISMSFTFPALGLTDEDAVEQNDIPTFNMTSARFDFTGDFPENPTPSKGTLELVFGEDLVENPDQRKFMDGDTDGGTSLLVSSLDQTNITVTMTQFPSGAQDQVVINETGVNHQIENETAEYNVILEMTDRENIGTSNLTATVEFDIINRPEDKNWISMIGLLGVILSGGELLGQSVLWIGSVIYWGIGFIFEVALNLIGMMLDIAIFGFAMMHWIINTFNAILAGTEGWAAVFIMIPLILLFYEFVKLIMIGISLLPTT